MTAWRLLRIFFHLCRGLLTCALIFPWISRGTRNGCVRDWSRSLLEICGVSVEVIGELPAQARALVVANHISWLDIFVINAVHPCRFVAKSDIRDWPMLGWLCHKAGTIFISRGRARDVRRIFKDLVASLKAGEAVAFFPEGTTASQGTVLPFHANLFEAAIDAGVPLQPMALRYVDRAGKLHMAADYIGDTTFADSMMTILRAKSIRAQLLVLPGLPSTDAHRRELALAAHAVISEALARAA